ncbi:hypothetical protein FACS1894171_1970 [Clostridia bacterium]|nr:hypothetical protein FACS1894171_1970 [Clostridia bacterium]
MGSADVIVTDGFSGNIYLKTIEGMGMFFVELLRDMFTRNMASKLAAAAVGKSLKDLKKLMDYNETGGAPLLGIGKPVIKAHGSSKALTVRSAVKQAIGLAETNLINEITENIEHMKAGE